MARNGTDFGIQLAGTGGKWFTGPAPVPDALYFPGFSKKDANPDIGDSAITETNGLGGFAIAASPAIVQFVGGAASDALRYTRRMYEITAAENNVYQIPALDFRGTPDRHRCPESDREEHSPGHRYRRGAQETRRRTGGGRYSQRSRQAV